MTMTPRSLLTSLVCLGFFSTLSLTAASGQDSAEGKYLKNIRQLTSGQMFVKAGEGYFSPDGKQIVYQAQPLDYPFYQIYTQPLDGGKPKLVSTGRGRTTCAYFSPDGKGLMFASSHLDPKLDETEAAERKQQEEDRRNNVRPEWPEPQTADRREGLRRRRSVLGRRQAHRLLQRSRRRSGHLPDEC
jgi:hypothetical protein